MKESSENSIFEIHNSDVNILEILREIESQLPKKEVDENDILRISQLSSEKIDSKQLRFFDPALTAYLFEKGITPPKFSNPKLWFVRGPLKWLIHKLIDLYSLFDKKISENRTKAFYNLVHEVMLANQRHKALEQKFYELLQDYINLKTQITKQPSTLEEIKNSYLTISFEKLEGVIWNYIQKKEAKNVLLLYPQTFELIRKLEISNISFFCITNQNSIYEFLKKNYTGNIQYLEEPLEYENIGTYELFVICKNLSEFPSWSLQKIFFELKKQIPSLASIYAWFKNSSITSTNPFQENFPTKIQLDLLGNYLHELGFSLLGYEILDSELFILNIQKK